MIEEHVDSNGENEREEREHGEPDDRKRKQAHADDPHKTYTRPNHHHSVEFTTFVEYTLELLNYFESYEFFFATAGF